MKTTRRNNLAFTLVELMVAIAITVVLLLAVNGILATASDAIGTGTGASDIIANARAINDQIHRDGQEMVGPQDSGFLVITHQLILDDGDNSTPEGVPVIEQDLVEGGRRTPVRSDQLVFVRNTKDIEPIAPGNANSYSNTSSAPHALIRYGHALRTNPDGTSNLTGSDYHRLGIAPNELAANWVFGRQALFLEDVQFPMSKAHLVSAAFDAQIASNGNSGTYRSSIPSNGEDDLPTVLFMGLHDIADQELQRRDATGNPEGIVDILSDNNYDLDSVHNYTYGKQRLRVNPTPAVEQGFASWQIAQMHPYFGGHVSDIVVEFAGDYEAPFGEIDTDTDQSGTDVNNISYDYYGGNIKWYTSGPFYQYDYGSDVPPSSRYEIFFVNDPSDSGNYDSTEPATYELPTGSSQTTQAAPPNEFYYNTSGNPEDSLSTTILNASASFTWRHDDDGVGLPSKWPHLIRIRYRLHDAEGQVIGADDNPGKWFEVIIPVNRP